MACVVRKLNSKFPRGMRVRLTDLKFVHGQTVYFFFFFSRERERERDITSKILQNFSYEISLGLVLEFMSGYPISDMHVKR